MTQHKFLLDESRLPKAWYNINPDMPVPAAPVLHPGTHDPVTPDFLAVLFPMGLIAQEVSAERWIEIPEPVREMYRLWRPTPLHRAVRLERALDTPAHIYYKYEGVSPVGSHKPNTAVAQAFYCREEGVESPEALPAHHHGELRRRRVRESDGPHPVRPPRARRGSDVKRLTGHRHLGGRGDRRHERRAQEVQSRVGPELRADAPDRDRARGARAAG